MRALISSAVLVAASFTVPLAAHASPTGVSQTKFADELPPGCFYIFDRLICVDMPI
jgi:hypothetical protein